MLFSSLIVLGLGLLVFGYAFETATLVIAFGAVIFLGSFVVSYVASLIMQGGEALGGAAQSDGVDVTLRIWEGMWHVFEFYRELPEARASMTEVCEWISSRLN